MHLYKKKEYQATIVVTQKRTKTLDTMSGKKINSKFICQLSSYTFHNYLKVKTKHRKQKDFLTKLINSETKLLSH